MEKYLGIASVIILILAGMVAYLAFTGPSEEDIEARMREKILAESRPLEKKVDKPAAPDVPEDKSKPLPEAKIADPETAELVKLLLDRFSVENRKQLSKIIRQKSPILRKWLSDKTYRDLWEALDDIANGRKPDPLVTQRIKKVLKLNGKPAIAEANPEAAGDIALEQGDLNKAIRAYLEARTKKSNPALLKKLTQTLALRAENYAKIGNFTKSIEDLSLAIDISPSEDIYVARGDIYNKTKQHEAAVQDYDKAIALENTNSHAFAGLAEAHLAMDNTEIALKHANTALKLNLKSAKAYHVKGVANLLMAKNLMRSGASDDDAQKQIDRLKSDALKALNMAARLDTKSEQTYLERGKLLLAAGEIALAAQDFERVLLLNNKNHEALLKKAFIMLVGRQHKEARFLADQVIKLNPELAKAYHIRALSRIQANETDNAMADFNKAISLDPNDYEFFFHRGKLFVQKNELKSALSDFTKAIALNPRDHTIFMTRAIVYFRMPDLLSALKDADSAINANPKNPEAYNLRAIIHKKMGNDDLAAKDKATAQEVLKELAGHTRQFDAITAKLGVDPWSKHYKAPPKDTTWGQIINKLELDKLDNTTAELVRNLRDAYFNEAIEKIRELKLPEAAMNLTRALELDANFTNGYVARGAVQIVRGEFEGARRDFTNVINGGEKNALAYYLRGKTFEALGKPIDAERDFEQAKRLDPKLTQN